MNELPQNPIINQFPEQSRELTEEEKIAMQEIWDNEMIRFFAELSKNESVKDIIKFITDNEWSDRQLSTIRHYVKVVLGRGLSTTFITSQTDYLMLKDDKALIDCDIPLGMTTYDMTPEFNILMGMVRLHFNIESRKSMGGKFLNSIGKHTHEFVHEDRIKPQTTGFFGGNK